MFFFLLSLELRWFYDRLHNDSVAEVTPSHFLGPWFPLGSSLSLEIQVSAAK